MPDERTVRSWALADVEGFAAQYAHAREIGYQNLADELLEIADNLGGEWGRDRLRVDTRKWLLSKALPKVYGDKQQIEHSGSLNFGEQLALIRSRQQKNSGGG